MVLMSITVLSVMLILMAQVSQSKRLKGQLLTDHRDAPFSDWAFLTRFCFLSSEGNFEFSISYPAKLGTQQILLYYDDIWKDGYSRDKNCSSRRSLLTRKLGQIVDLSPDYTSSCKKFKKDNEEWITCSDSRYFRTSRERWWFLVVANCGAQRLQMEYKLHLTNGEDFLHKEYSADEFYIFPIDMAFFFMNLFLCVISVWIAMKMISCQLFHTTYKLFMASLWLYTFHLMLMSIAQGVLGTSGVESYGCEVTGHVVETISHVIFVLMLILVAKGYTITRGRISSFGTILITGFMVIYVLLFAGVFIWEAIYFDEANVLYRYESIPGYLMMGLRMLGWVWFLVCVIFTVNHYPEKMKFYIPFAAFYSIWFLAGPVVMLISVKVLAKWTREKTVCGVENFVTILANAAFMILTWPARVNKMFPFHVKTSQIAVMTSVPHQQPGDEGFPEPELSMRNANNGPYGPNFTDIFVVSHSRSVEFEKPSTSVNQNTAPVPQMSFVLPPINTNPNRTAFQETSLSSQNPPSYSDVVASAPEQ